MLAWRSSATLRLALFTEASFEKTLIFITVCIKNCKIFAYENSLFVYHTLDTFLVVKFVMKCNASLASINPVIAWFAIFQTFETTVKHFTVVNSLSSIKKLKLQQRSHRFWAKTTKRLFTIQVSISTWDINTLHRLILSSIVTFNIKFSLKASN